MSVESVGMSGAMMIAAHEARDACKGEPDVTQRLRKAMGAVKNHWMCVDYQERFKAALAGAMLESPPSERAGIQASFDRMAKLSAALAAAQRGVPVDWEAMLAADDPNIETIPLQKLWVEIAGDRR